MDKKEKYIAKTKGGTETMSTEDAKLLKLYKKLGTASSDKEKLMTYKALNDIFKDVKGIPSDFDVKMLKKALPTNKDGGMVKKYRGGGSVHNNKKNMITTRGWGASRKT
jgi:uncharacterized protein (UPF0335 family)|tara:strand:+ start:71 stop:397 length:327 start_codon:yes stop_codon:yes gene_type:complete